MASLKFYKLNALPGTLQPDSFYLVQNGNYAETYVTTTAGVAKAVGNTVMIQNVATQVVSDYLSDFNALEIVNDIPERDALAASNQRNFIVLVSDATGDPTVTNGAALYAYREADTTFIKLSEYESMDVTIQWSSIQGRPTSSPAQIDDAVSKAHTHSNKAVLDGLSDSSGNLYYNGSPVSALWQTTAW